MESEFCFTCTEPRSECSLSVYMHVYLPRGQVLELWLQNDDFQAMGDRHCTGIGPRISIKNVLKSAQNRYRKPDNTPPPSPAPDPRAET